jgi:hypothetical protein
MVGPTMAVQSITGSVDTFFPAEIYCTVGLLWGNKAGADCYYKKEGEYKRVWDAVVSTSTVRSIRVFLLFSVKINYIFLYFLHLLYTDIG